VPVLNFIRHNHDVDYVDIVTVPGPDKVLSKCKDVHEIGPIKKKVLISSKKHNARIAFIIGHYDCAGNTCARDRHITQIRKAVQNIKNWNTGLEVYGLWVNKEWKVSLIK